MQLVDLDRISSIGANRRKGHRSTHWLLSMSVHKRVTMCCMMGGDHFPADIVASLLVDWDTWLCMFVWYHKCRNADRDRFLAGQMHVFRPRTDLARVLLALVPLVGAALIAISRCEDYRHDVYDVTIGSIIGMFLAYFSYRRYYPSLNSPRCDTPYPSRADTASERGYGKRKDEEARIWSAGDYEAETLDNASEHMPLQQATTDKGRRGSQS